LIEIKKIKVDRGEDERRTGVTDKYLYMRNRGGSKTLNETVKRREDEVKIVVLYYKEAAA